MIRLFHLVTGRSLKIIKWCSPVPREEQQVGTYCLGGGSLASKILSSLRHFLLSFLRLFCFELGALTSSVVVACFPTPVSSAFLYSGRIPRYPFLRNRCPPRQLIKYSSCPLSQGSRSSGGAPLLFNGLRRTNRQSFSLDRSLKQGGEELVPRTVSGVQR